MTLEQMTEQEKRETIRANILADRITRAVQWAAFAAILFALVLPLAVQAWRAAGAVAALVVLALGMACTWHIKPHGKSYAAKCRLIDARHKPHE